MNDGQWRIVYTGVDYTFGTRDLPVFNATAPEIGTPDITAADVDRPRADGRAFGVDYRTGQSITFDLGIRSDTEASTREEAATLAKIWRADAVRFTPGAVAELHMQYAGRERLVYGRPRRWAPDNSEAATARLVGVTADFACLDDLFYSPTEERVTFGLVPASRGGGLLAPLAAPLSTTISSDRSQSITVVSDMPVWPVVVIHGPITNPIVSIPGVLEFEVRISLLYDETVVIDTRPWARSALRNGSANVAGSVRGTRLSQASIPSGTYAVSLKGTDPTGTASVDFSWRRTYSAL